MYKSVYWVLCSPCSVYRWLHIFLWNVQTLLKQVRTLIYPFGCCFLIRPAGWPVGWGWLLSGVMPIQVQAHKFNLHQPEALPAAFLPPPPPRTLQPPPLAAGLGAGGGSSPPGAALRPRPAGWRGWLRRRRRRRLRWKRRRRRRLAQVRYHLGPLTCAWPPWTCCNRWRSQPPRYPRNRLSGRFATATGRRQASFWSILPPLHPRAQVLVYSCCPRNIVDDESIQITSDVIYTILASIQQNIYLKCVEILQCAWQHQWKLKNQVNQAARKIH